jgi:hypothetical protein
VKAAFAAYLVALVGGFLVLYALFTRGQAEGGAVRGLQEYWASSFPPLDNSIRFLVWLVSVHTGTMFAYPWGGSHGSSFPTTIGVAAGAVLLWRHGRKTIVIALLAPFALTLAAAALRRYPYGGEARQMQYLAPAICLLAGLGAAAVLRLLPWPRGRYGLAGVYLLLLALTAPDFLWRDLVSPCRFPCDIQARDFARRFWPDLERGAEVACARGDFGLRDRTRLNLRTAAYLCNEWIYSPQRRRGGGPRWEQVSADHPLRCVLYHEVRPELPEVVAWLDAMRSRYDLRRTESIDVDMSAVVAGPKVERWVVFEFVPKEGAVRSAGRAGLPVIQ